MQIIQYSKLIANGIFWLILSCCRMRYFDLRAHNSGVIPKLERPRYRNSDCGDYRNSGPGAVKNNERRSARYCVYTMQPAVPRVPHRSQLHQLSPATR
jgi:hypothetical protein